VTDPNPAAEAHAAVEAAFDLIHEAYKRPTDLALYAAALRARSAAWSALADAAPYGLHVHYVRALLEASTGDAVRAAEFERLIQKEAGQ
jgi:hypothetical protein